LHIYDRARTHSYLNLEEVKKSVLVGCYYCKRVYAAQELGDSDCLSCREDMVIEPTVFCKYCGIDSVIGSASGYPVSSSWFLHLMNKCGFH
jgi:hypothetical protein